ncbi:cysteine desulfurase [Puccinia graminis f. sp. tritici]|uniref:Cysteine desulfurase n=1 Tax=Puccinia graminis f. sp. tritici TaxID=56615 RepID=A0A5B0NU96_PUCGR|nr:cysteine desulfurase [Puccinia graminis f. sp. tritici]KAA1091388.1 cysteine desulfurase [Puccinia graminis f. sp. tritici]
MATTSKLPSLIRLATTKQRNLLTRSITTNTQHVPTKQPTPSDHFFVPQSSSSSSSSSSNQTNSQQAAVDTIPDLILRDPLISSRGSKQAQKQQKVGRPIYLDMQATTPLDPRVLDAMMPYMTNQYGNPHSKTHAYGWETEKAVETARAHVADLIGASTKDIIFTSGATETNNMAVKGVSRFYKVLLTLALVLSPFLKNLTVRTIPRNANGISSLPRPNTNASSILAGFFKMKALM